jgi:ribosome-associated protein
MESIVVNERVSVPASAVTFQAARASGPGGQNVNKVSSKVELRVDIAAIDGLTSDQRHRLRAANQSRMDEEGRLVVTSQTTRSQLQNLEEARDKIRQMVASALVAPKRRIATKPTRASKARRLDSKKKNAEKKKGRRDVGY